MLLSCAIDVYVCSRHYRLLASSILSPRGVTASFRFAAVVLLMSSLRVSLASPCVCRLRGMLSLSPPCLSANAAYIKVRNVNEPFSHPIVLPVPMRLLDLPPEVLSLIVNDTDRDTLLSLCLTEKHLYDIARRFLRRNVAVVFDACQKPKPNLFSFDFARLSAIRSLSLVVRGWFELDSGLCSRVFMCMVNLNHVRVIGGSGVLVRSIAESTATSLATLELEGCDAEPQDFTGMAPINIRRLSISHCDSNARFLLGPLVVEELEVYGPGLDGGCMNIGVALRRLTDGNLKRLYVIDTCRDPGCRDIVHLTRALETRLASLEVLVLDISLPQSALEKLVRTVSMYPALKTLYLRGLPLFRTAKVGGVHLAELDFPFSACTIFFYKTKVLETASL
ncbi:uncharacterized protein EV420DRAFT_1180996 [Desarmillaria tabescens]|uniref:F-box domain-containing protein n=1 Tax=Armillaria tabescens TaxID=1929756 RepID=A0AA39NAY9_ARMTA|nr:uncharacterized protein EV420DRAFT_1180996 [Desarmillaria tabescens]KAK0462301.1 hypothetical protein EV420DRAFT_1180996 [Desarmillaria tabescens]